MGMDKPEILLHTLRVRSVRFRPMKILSSLALVLLLCSARPAWAQDADPIDPSHLSPDGRFRFEAFSGEEVDAGKRPAFGIVETAGGKLVSNPDEDLGDAYRPEETILWAPDSAAYALTTRVGTRHLDTYLYRWDGRAFVRATWEGSGQLEAWADEELKKDMKAQGFSDEAGLGRCIQGDCLPERWLDPRRLILTWQEGYVVGEGDRESTAEGSSRAIVQWDAKSAAYAIDRQLPLAEPWPFAWEDPDPFTVEQTSPQGGDSTARRFSIRKRETGETLHFEADHWLTAPTTLAEEAGWPQLELESHGPEGFLLRRLYRVVGGSYRCVRVDEMTTLARLAPEEAPRVAFLSETRSPAYLLRTRHLGADGTDTYESFQTATPSPDGKSKVVFTYHPQYLQRIEIAPAAGTGEPTVIYDFDDGEGSVDSVAYALWSPDSRSVALYQVEGPRVGGTRLYRSEGGDWAEAEMPERDYGFLKESLDSGANWYQQFERPLWWNGPRELVIQLDGNFRGGDAPDYRALSTLTWDKQGKALKSASAPQDVQAPPLAE